MFLSTFVKPKYLLIIICILFLFTRLYKISEIPSSVYWDEASIGYNAYSIAQTGKDEWGDFLPIHFRAFGEFKLPIYIYSVVPFIKVFGLNEFSVRIPSVIFSLGVVILTYFLGRRLTGNTLIGLWSIFFVTISPWFFIFSRTGYEATAGLMFYILGIYLFLSYKQNKWLIFFSVFSFILSIYSYNSFRIISPLTILVLFFFGFTDFTSSIKGRVLPLIFSFIVITLSMIPIVRLYTLEAGGLSRFQAVGVESSGTFFKNYLSYFSLDFLLTNGDRNLRSQQAGFGQLNLVELIFILIGSFFIISKKIKYGLLTGLLLLLSPVPAALTKESPHALRSIATVPFLAILSAFGVIYTGKFLKFRYFEIIVVLALTVFLMHYFVNFITVYPGKASEAWQYGYKKIFMDYEDEFQKYDRIIISDAYAQPYIFALFYLKYDPEKFQREVVRNSIDKWGFSTVSKFGKFEFGKVNELLKSGNGKRLIFASTMEEVANADTLGTINFLDETLAFRVYSKQ